MKTLVFNASFILILLLISCNNQNSKAPAVESTTAENATAVATDSTTITYTQSDSSTVKGKEGKEEQEEKEEKEDK